MTGSSLPADPQLLRQIAHDLRSELFVVTMGLEQLRLLRQDEQQFREVMQLVSTDTIERMKLLIDALADEAHRASANDSVNPSRS